MDGGTMSEAVVGEKLVRATPFRGAVTIEEVAAAAGVSRSTVSRVVNGSTAVSPAALDAVNRAIAELNYVPNRAARSLASRQTRALALVVPEDTTRFLCAMCSAYTRVQTLRASCCRSDWMKHLKSHIQ